MDTADTRSDPRTHRKRLSHRRHERARYVVISLEAIVALAALGGGTAMIADPAGAMGLQPQMLDRLPVDSWLLPGVALIACNGALPTAAALADLRGHSWPRRFGHALAGAVLLAWPVTETFLFGYPLQGEPVWLRPTVAAAGLTLIGYGLCLRATFSRARGLCVVCRRGTCSHGTHTLNISIGA